LLRLASRAIRSHQCGARAKSFENPCTREWCCRSYVILVA